MSERCSRILIPAGKSRHCPPPCPILKTDARMKFSSQTGMDCYTFIHFLSIVYTYHPNIARRHKSNGFIGSKCEQSIWKPTAWICFIRCHFKKNFDNAFLALYFSLLHLGRKHAWLVLPGYLRKQRSKCSSASTCCCISWLVSVCANPNPSLNLFLAAAHRTSVTAANTIMAACKKYLSYIRQLFGGWKGENKTPRSLQIFIFEFLASTSRDYGDVVSKHSQNMIFRRAANYVFKAKKVDILTFRWISCRLNY